MWVKNKFLLYYDTGIGNLFITVANINIEIGNLKYGV